MIPPEILALIPGCGECPPRAVHRLPGGRGCNSVLRVDTDAGRFVVRQRHPPLDRPGSAALTELRAQLLAGEAGLAPRIIHAALDGSWLLMEFVEGQPWTEQRLVSPDGLSRLGRQLALLHSVAVPERILEVDANAIAAGYLQQLGAREASQAEFWRPVVSRVQELSLALQRLGGVAVLTHGDLQVDNMLGDLPVLVDWEYAQVAHPTYDIACLLTYYPALERQLGPLLDTVRLSNKADRAVLDLQRQRFSCLNQLWDAVNNVKTG